jgi:glycine/D-amino acid oxidase-like deaminating enzyme
MRHFSTIVIGKGLLGSAAAKYLAAQAPDVALIGPDEPTDYAQALVFSSHYDQARVQRLIGKDDVWTRLNQAAVQQYAAISAQSGIDFHGKVGCLYVNPYGQDDYLANAPAISARFNLDFKSYTQAPARDFPDFRFPDQAQGLFENAPAGFINPRQLIKAQVNIFEQHHGTVLQETVLDISYKDAAYQVRTADGNTYQAPKVLLAAGAFINFFNLITKPLDLKLKSEVVLLAKVNPAQAAQLSQLPSLLYEIDNGETEGIYLIQPVQYPDGAFYLKMGCNMPEDIFFENIEQVQDWFRHGDSDRFIPRLKTALEQLMPGLAFESFLTKRCIISRTPHGRPYIGETERAGLYVAGGCNGYSAMCSDGIGQVAAHLVGKGAFPAGFDSEDFELVYKC